MCGITGYIGKGDAKEFLMSGLEKLEYRGYDSAGICIGGNRLKLCKTKGRLGALKEAMLKSDLNGNIGIGHTRWATHGEPTDVNSHPHLSEDGNFAVVHNGIIENYSELREMLAEKGYRFLSQTDTEVIPNLIQFCYEGDVLESIVKATEYLKGAYALGIISTYQPETIFAVRKDSPLIVGIGDGENFLASDIPAILSKTRNVYLLETDEFAVLTKNRINFFNKSLDTIEKEIFKVTWDIDAAEKDGYDFYMLKEIMEQPKAVANTISPRIKNGKIDLSEISLSDNYFKNLKNIFIVACGSAYHAGLIGKNLIEGLGRIPVSVELASEFRYRNPVINKGDLVIVISQSGETSDTLAALRYAKSNGAEILSVVNVKGSTIARESDNVIYTHAGPEIAVATTKAYMTQMCVLMLLGVHIASVKGRISDGKHVSLVRDMEEISQKLEKLLSSTGYLSDLAKRFTSVKDVFFIGRGIDYSVAMEGSLKLKEISYIHSESYAAGELKHGTISLIEEGTLVIALCTQKSLFEKMLSNIKEVKARGAYVIAIGIEGMNELKQESDCAIFVPEINEYFTGALEVVPLQIFAYYIALHKGLDVDKPRNLAKSVTVE